MEAFQDRFDLSDEIKRAILDMGYDEPTPIQEGAIPPMLLGRDIIGQAQTGTGKTAAFGIPLMNEIDTQSREVQAIVLCPTRELCMQTAGELMKLARYKRGLNTLAVYGGQPIERQLRGLQQGAQVVVGTPGRVMDHMNRGSLDLSSVKIAVLDEADEMLDMGFRGDIETILQQTPKQRQTALFSATMPREILNLGRSYLTNPEHVRIAAKQLTVDLIQQTYIAVRSFHKLELLARLLVKHQTKLALVFCNTKRGVEDIVTQLVSRGFAAAGLHGDMRQIERDAIMSRFRQGMVSILVATDVAARGIDVDDIEAVFNYDLPLDVEYYVHRIGRTGRAGKVGRAYSFVTGQEISKMWDYRRITGAKILCEQSPTGEELKRIKMERKLSEIRERLGLDAQAPQDQNLEKTETDDAESEVDRLESEMVKPEKKAEALPEGASLAEVAMSLLNGAEPGKLVETMLGMLLDMGDNKTKDELDIKLPEPTKLPRPAQQRPYSAPRRTPYGQPTQPAGARNQQNRGYGDRHSNTRNDGARYGQRPYAQRRDEGRKPYTKHQG